MRYKPIALAAAALATGLAAAPASANLVQLSDVQLTGQGIGATFTTLTLQATGASTTESGGVLFNGNVFGDALTGASQSSTFTFADLSISNASQLALIVNLAEPGSEDPPSVTTAASTLSSNANLANAITLNVYSAGGTLIQQHTANSGLTLNQIAGGVGGSGLVFGLDGTEQSALNAIMASTAGNEVFTVGATFANAQGGNDTIQAARLTQVSAVPEPESYALLLAGLGALGFVSKRRSPRS
jgi:hypothetical protein